jgi:hypothetical protein
MSESLFKKLEKRWEDLVKKSMALQQYDTKYDKEISELLVDMAMIKDNKEPIFNKE